jgi:putative DNA methylase
LEATVDYPFRFGEDLGIRTRKWAKVWGEHVEQRLARFYPKQRFALVHAYIFARTVPCPDTQYPTPLVPDWHLLKPKSGMRIVAEPVVDKAKGTWSVRTREIGRGAGQLRDAPRPTYHKGKGISLFTDRLIPADYIKAKAQAGEMRSTLYVVVTKTPQGLKFQPPEPVDLVALEEAEKELARLRPGWERASIIPTERIPNGDQPGTRLLIGGIGNWADMFSSRQLLALGVLVEELQALRPILAENEKTDLGEAIQHFLSLAIDKFINYNSVLASWHAPHSVVRSVFDRHGFSFKPAFAEMALCNAGTGLDWTIDNVLEAYEEICRLSSYSSIQPVEISLGSATTLPQITDGTITTVVVDPPYAANVQYAELANFFYIWLKRAQGHRRPEWFSTYLCETDQEAVVNISRHRQNGTASAAKGRAHVFYQNLMTDTFKECRRILRDDGVLTVMFTHKKQEAWEALFSSLIRAGFIITATWPVKTESEHSLHQAKKNAAQSTVSRTLQSSPFWPMENSPAAQ